MSRKILTRVKQSLVTATMSRVTMVEGVVETARGTRRTPADKYDERRTQLAISALATLGELGYAKTSLREIAQNSEFSHGVVHYYFADKFELITHCVRYYKAQCVTRYDGLVAESSTDTELLTRFADKLVETMTTEAPMHRLWYDLRTQSMFEEQFRPDVLVIDATLQEMIGRVVTKYAELAGRPLALDIATTYALLDGVFENALLAHLVGDASASDDLRSRVTDLLPRLLG
jgi:TetR/AcrR family transcriptional regulator, transcriptional repressor of bet genes